MTGNELDPAAIGTGIGIIIATAGTVFTIIRNAMAKWGQAQEKERAEQAERTAAERTEYHQVVTRELRKAVGPIRRRLAHLEGAVDALLRGTQPTRPTQRKRGGR